MIKRSPSRNNRTRGIKVKHILQIILLLGVFFWLIYQVKHSRDKKNEYDENDGEVSVGTKTVYPTPKLGRKDLHRGKDEDKHEHNEREEEGNEHEFEENDDKLGVRVGGDEEEEDESRSDEMEDERGGGDDEIDETDQEQSAADIDRDEDLPDDDEEKEEDGDEKENSSKEEEKDGSVEKHNSHEAREQHYKGDDASSAVTHDTSTTSTETVSLLENPEVNLDFNNKEAELAGEQSSNASLFNAVYSSHLHNVTTTFLDSHSEAGTNLTVVIAGGSNDLTRISANTSFEPNKTVIFSESYQTQNGTGNTTVTGVVKSILTEGLVQGGNKVSEENQLGSNSAVPVEIEKGDAVAGESSNLEGGVQENTTKSVESNETDNNTEVSETNNSKNVSHTNENTDSIKDGFKGDSSDSHILKSVAEDRTDLDTLPDIIKEGDIVDAIATD
ncbi:uncharacterized protein DDB_G0290803 [Vigna radiata var. radiata]|uniref:Uncharacterized protein DDB_G0290803 n=1 Tax=Vigna radiata var. radiata TaxID=3916 RepID=A0A1S3VRL3_VIGRR|nr:uncharacterized protein DDB_G0290803 [Vigna radiata var. radiata]XP_022643160.1 uncharacterized protein DDB_G0290803 [Vigna radiata var. radiata]